MVMDVIGEKSADRLWIFQKNETTHGFDNGWDGRKMSESDITQLYVIGTDENQLQLATIPTINNVTLGFEADNDGQFTLEFSLSEHLNNVELYLYDQITGTRQWISNGSSYSFEANKGDSTSRFRLISSNNNTELSGDEALIEVSVSANGNIVIINRSNNSCTAFISNNKGELIQSVEVGANDKQMVDGVSAGIYVIRLQNSMLNDARRVIVK